MDPDRSPSLTKSQLDELARRTNVPIDFVQRLFAVGALSDDFPSVVERQLGRVRLLHAWSQAGPPETIMRLVDQRALSITFLDAAGVQAPRRQDRGSDEVAHARGLPESRAERLREAIHAGPVIFQDGDVYGRTVNLASRLASFAEAGEVVVSEDVERSAPGSTYEDVGPVALKGVKTPIRLFRAAS